MCFPEPQFFICTILEDDFLLFTITVNELVTISAEINYSFIFLKVILYCFLFSCTCDTFFCWQFSSFLSHMEGRSGIKNKRRLLFAALTIVQYHVRHIVICFNWSRYFPCSLKKSTPYLSSLNEYHRIFLLLFWYLPISGCRPQTLLVLWYFKREVNTCPSRHL